MTTHQLFIYKQFVNKEPIDAAKEIYNKFYRLDSNSVKSKMMSKIVIKGYYDSMKDTLFAKYWTNVEKELETI